MLIKAEVHLPALVHNFDYRILRAKLIWHSCCSLEHVKGSLMKSGRMGSVPTTALLSFWLGMTPTIAASPKLNLDFGLGYSKQYLDEPGDPLFGGSVLVRFGEHWAIGPEVNWIDGSRFKTLGVLARVAYLTGESNQRARLYLYGSCGLSRQEDKGITVREYKSNSLSYGGGLGVRIRLAEHFSLSEAGGVQHA